MNEQSLASWGLLLVGIFLALYPFMALGYIWTYTKEQNRLTRQMIGLLSEIKTALTAQKASVSQKQAQHRGP